MTDRKQVCGWCGKPLDFKPSAMNGFDPPFCGDDCQNNYLDCNGTGEVEVRK